MKQEREILEQVAKHRRAEPEGPECARERLRSGYGESLKHFWIGTIGTSGKQRPTRRATLSGQALEALMKR